MVHHLPGWFQSTHPRGVRQQQEALERRQRPRFQSTHPRGVRPADTGKQRNRRKRFNPRTREGCDCRRTRAAGTTSTVSIHAPARGATSVGPGGPSRCPCFNPRTREGCDHDLIANALGEECFNPRTREGCDGMCRCWRNRAGRFNPRTREGCDSGRVLPSVTDQVFQSTHPRGVRRPKRGNLPYAKKFQSTHPRGVRPRIPTGNS